jgi:hypothetical protein
MMPHENVGRAVHTRIHRLGYRRAEHTLHNFAAGVVVVVLLIAFNNAAAAV